MASLSRQLMSLCSSVNTRAILTKQPQRFLAVQRIRFASTPAGITKDELWKKKNQMIFRSIDHNGDNCFSQEDWQVLAEKLIDSGKYHPEDITAYINKCSHNSALMGLSVGVKWSLEEWSKAHKEQQKYHLYVSGLREMFDLMFTMLDKDGKGYLNMDDWENMIEIFRFNSREEAKAGFDSVDTNKNGEISRDEFTKFIYEFMCTADNELGTIDILGSLPK